MNLTRQNIQYLADTSHDRISFWVSFLQKIQARQMVEIGVYKGHFAAQILANCASLERYYLLDPWRHLDAWNKPSNQSDAVFDEYLAETRARTDFAKA